MNKLAETIIRDIWTRSEGTRVFLPQAVYRGVWWEGPALYKNADFPTELAWSEGWDSYFSVLSFTNPERTGANVEGDIGVMWLDLDYIPEDQEAYPYLLREVGFAPTYLWESSPGHYQAVWFTEPVNKFEWRALAKAFTDRIAGADPGGWHETKVLRVPGSINYKRGGVEGRVLIHPDVPRVIRPIDPWELSRMSGPLTTGGGSLPMPRPVSNDDRLRLLIREWQRLPLGVQHWLTISPDQYPYYAPRDRSLLIRGLLVQMKDAGLGADTAFHLIQGRPFDKFVDRPQDLWHEVLKAFGLG